MQFEMYLFFYYILYSGYYCMPDDSKFYYNSKIKMDSNDIYEISKFFVKYGITRIRLTGGEPTIRKDIVNICGF